MKFDFVALAIRLGLAWFLLTFILLLLYLAGAAQNFLESTQMILFDGLRWMSWGGLLLACLLLFPLARNHSRRILASFGLGLGFLAVFIFVVVWGGWIYPESGILSW